MTDEVRTYPALNRELQRRMDHGWRIEERGENWARLCKGEKTRHFTHIAVTVITLGVWGIVYGLVLIFGGRKSIRITETRRGKLQIRRGL